METVSLSEQIHAKIKELEGYKNTLPVLAEEKAAAEADYEKSLAMTIMGLRNGKEYQIDGETIQDQSTTLCDKLAKGICFNQKIRTDLADSKYKNALKIIDITESQLNGFQSINRHLSES